MTSSSQVRLRDVLVDPIDGSTVESSLGSYWLLSTRSKKSNPSASSSSVAGANAQDVNLHAVAKVVLAANFEAVGRALGPGVRVREEPMVVPERCLVLDPLVAEQTLDVRLVPPVRPSRLLDERRVTDGLLAVNQVG